MKKSMPNTPIKFIFLLICVLAFHGNSDAQTIKPTHSIETTKLFTSVKISSLVLDSFIVSQNLDSDHAASIKDFYKSRDNQYTWFMEEGLSEQAGQFWNLYEQYLNYSKDSVLFRPDLQQKWLKMTQGDSLLSKEEIQFTELQFTSLFFDFVSRAYAGTVNPSELKWHIPKKKLELHALLKKFAIGDYEDLEDWAPIGPGYFLLREKLMKLYRLNEKNKFFQISSSRRVYRPADAAPEITLVKKRLFLLGDLPALDSTHLYNNSLFEAVIRFQKRHGLVEDGLIGPAVFKHLNTPIKEKIERILVNLERMRWMPNSGTKRRVLVNIPEFKLRVYEEGRQVLNLDVVVGKAANRTVIFSDEIKHVVFSPYWNLPQSIVKNEVMPGLEHNPDYLRLHNMEIVGERNGLPTIRQKPGSSNALGKVKFIFPNRYSIYLHDTPAKTLFERNRRAFSHGCIRVRQPRELAKLLLSGKPEWSEDSITDAMNSGNEKWVALNEPVPVYITYFTAWVGDLGELNFREDIYGHDRKLARHLFESPSI